MLGEGAALALAGEAHHAGLAEVASVEAPSPPADGHQEADAAQAGVEQSEGEQSGQSLTHVAPLRRHGGP